MKITSHTIESKPTSFVTERDIDVDVSVVGRMVALMASAVLGGDSSTVLNRAKTFEGYLTGKR